MSHAQAAARGTRKPHVLPLRIYLMVFGALLVLTVITVRVSYFNFGTWNLIVAMAVATVKASLVALFFMHLKYDEKFNAVLFLGSLAFLGIFFVLTLADTMHRGLVDPIKEHEILPVPGRPEFMKEHGVVLEGLADSTAAVGDTLGGAMADTAHATGAPAPPAESGGH